jgi:exonuclease VII small subunit
LWNESKDNFVKNSQKTIDRYLKKENKRLRERIKSVRFVDPEEMLKFTNEISKIVHKLHQKKLKINRANISKNYRSGSNSYQTLRRKLEDLNLTFDELLEIVNTKNQ